MNITARSEQINVRDHHGTELKTFSSTLKKIDAI
jgi:hypothetical protein